MPTSTTPTTASPTNPFWYVDGCRTQAEALSAACAQLAALDQAIASGAYPARLSDVGLSA